MQVRLLGPVEVFSGGLVTAVPGLRRRAVLAVLGLHQGRTVSIDQLIDVVWDERPPATATNTLQRNISYLRELLGSKDSIVAKPPGYLLDTGEPTDVEEAERLICRGRQASSPREAVGHLRAALALWRGGALADVAELRWLGEQAQRLSHTEFEATRCLVDARLALGEHAQLVPELDQLITDRPFDEDLHRQQMLALYRAGQQAESLARYQRFKRTLAEDLGIDPGQALRDLEAAILRQDSSLDAPRAQVTVAPAVPAPAQLPLSTAAFAARAKEIARLDAVMAGHTDNVCLAVVSGTAGVGKTTLAVHWAHRHRQSFPDGQLYADLRGFDRGGSVADPSTVLRAFLDAFGVPLEKIPADPDAQSALYRSVLAGKKVLVVLDNARDAEQVRPLLPGTPGCAVLVTSRYQLTALVMVEGAYPLTLELLTDDEARELLVRRIGNDRVAGEEAAIQEIITRCARLPLALALAAASCVTRPDLAVPGVAAELRHSSGTLEALQSVDSAIDLRSVFSWSYQALSPDTARVFRLLGQHPGPDFTAEAAASLTGLTVGEVRSRMAELLRANLLTQPKPGRYSLHDLLWTYAADLSQPDRDEGFPRLLDHYLHTALSAAVVLHPHREPPELRPPRPGVLPQRPAGREEAGSWFTGERAVLLSLVRRAARQGLDDYVWRLAWTMYDYLDRWGHWEEQVANQKAAIESTKRLAEPAAQAHAHCSVSTAYARMARYAEAQTELGHALELFASLGDCGGQAKVQYQMGWVSNRQGQHKQAVGHARQALRLYRLAGQPAMAARTLNSLGWGHALLGDFARARSRCELALAQMRAQGDLTFEAGTSDSLGYIYHHLGDFDLASKHYRRALELFRRLEDRYYEADTLKHLGDTHCAAGDVGAALASWREALEILDRLGHPDAAEVREKLSSSAAPNRSRTRPAVETPTTAPAHTPAGSR